MLRRSLKLMVILVVGCTTVKMMKLKINSRGDVDRDCDIILRSSSLWFWYAGMKNLSIFRGCVQ